MCNKVLKGAISTALALPRYTLWATTAVVITFSADAGLSMMGEHLGVVAGTAVAVAGEGSFVNYNSTAGLVGSVGIAIPSDCVTGLIDASPGLGFATDATITYASEVFASGSPKIPLTDSTQDDNKQKCQSVVYTISGAINKQSKISFDLSGGATFATAKLNIVEPGMNSCQENQSIPYTLDKINTDVAASGASNVSCSVGDGTKLQLFYRLAGVANTLKTPGGKIEMTAKITGVSPAIPLNSTRTITVVDSKLASQMEITPEMGRQGYVFVSIADDNKLFVDKAPVTASGENPFISDERVKIGYIKTTLNNAADLTGEKAFTLGGSANDKATMKITNGQFKASPGGVNAAGVPYIDASGKQINATSVEDDGTTAVWTLTADDLKSIASAEYKDQSGTLVPGAPIGIKANRTSEINDVNVEVGAAPSAQMDITPAGQTAAIVVGPVDLRRIPRDGVTCWVYNVPPPAANLDKLSVRITNDSARAGTIIGTLYPDEGGDTPDFMSINLLTKIGAADPRYSQIEMVTDSSGVPQPGLKGGATIRLSAQDIADVGGVTWDAGRKVLKISSAISEMEVLSLLRYGAADNQPQSNISTGVKGTACE